MKSLAEKRKAREYEQPLSEEEKLFIIAQYNRLTTEEKRDGIRDKFNDLNDQEKRKFLFAEIKSLRAKEALYLNKLIKLHGLEPEKPPLPYKESQLVLRLLKMYKSKGFTKVTYAMLKTALELEISNVTKKPYKVNSSIIQMRTFLSQTGTTIGPRVYVSIGTDSTKIFPWLAQGPIELFGGCADGEQRTHWIDLTKGLVAELEEGA